MMGKIFKYILIGLIVFLALPINLYTQNKTYTSDTVLFDIFNGKISFSYVLNTDESKKKDGKFVFSSNIEKKLNEENISLNTLDISGFYKDDSKIGTWQFLFNDYTIEKITFKKRNDIQLDYQVNGLEKKYIINFKNDLKHGKWELKTKTINNGKYGNETLKASINFHNDSIIGPFIFNTIIDNIPVEINGNINQWGFLDGKLIIKYSNDNRKIKEERIYKDGFLIELTKYDEDLKKIISKLEYSDVVNYLKELENKNMTNDLKKSGDVGFGIEFNIGYNSDDYRITEQKIGNKLIVNALESFDFLYFPFSDNLSGNQQLKLTRRFQYVYPQYEDSLMNIIIPKITTLYKDLNNIINQPNVKLRKSYSENISMNYYWFIHSKTKVEIMIDVLNKIETGYFEYKLRDSYYENGLIELNTTDTINYQFKGESRSTLFDNGYFIDNSDSLVLKMLIYTELLNKNFLIKKDEIKQSLIFYENQDYLDSLDTKINKYSIQLDSLYTQYFLIENPDPKEIPFSFKIYTSLNDRLLSKLTNHYINDYTEDIQVLINYGNDLSCYLKFLTENKNILDKIGKFPQIWNDSLFTIYRENPFDFRMLESKILPSTQQSVNVLLNYYANNMLNAKTCESLYEELTNILRLEKRVEYIVKNYESENVQLLEKTLKRERVPVRIKRLLEL